MHDDTVKTQIDYSTIVSWQDNREMDKLNTTSQVSNITRKTTFSPTSWHIFQDQIFKCKKRK